MKSSLLLLLLLAPLSLCGFINRDPTATLPPSMPASYVLATLPSSLLPATIFDAQYTSLASALYAVERDFYNHPQYATVAAHMWSAAAQASDSVTVVPSLALSAWAWDSITAAAWYADNMPKEDKSHVDEFMVAWDVQYQKFVHGGGKDAKTGGDEKEGAAAGGSAAQSMEVVWSVAALAGVIGFAAVM